MDAEALQGRRDRLEHQLDAGRSSASRSAGPSALGGELARELVDVVALVAVLGRLRRRASAPRSTRRSADLAAGVVDVVLALDLVAGELEQPRERVAVGGVAAARRGQRPGRVGGDELDEDPLGLAAAPGRRARRRRRAGRRRPPVPAVGEEEVDEARARRPRPGRAAARRAAELLGEPLGDRARLSPRTGASSIAALVE